MGSLEADLGERCVECGHSTAFGDGRFVNRLWGSITIDTNAGDKVTVSGYLCELCQQDVCEWCGTQVNAYEAEMSLDGPICDECAERYRKKHGLSEDVFITDHQAAR